MKINDVERQRAQANLFAKLSVAQSQSAAGEKGIGHSEMMRRLRRIGRSA